MPDGKKCGFARLGGRTLLSWQVDLAHDLGCERFVCLTEAKHEAFDELRAQIEGFGGEFHTISGPMPLVSLLSADQELVVIADGLIADRELVSNLLEQQRGVLCLPDEVGIAAGFERIDAQHAWAGIFVARAQIAERLAEMPPDSDTVSLLLRLALQSGGKLIPMDTEVLQTGEWLLMRSGSDLEVRDRNLLDATIERVSWWEPTRAISRRLARSLAPDGLENGPLIAGVAGGLSLAGALTASYFANQAAGFALLGLTVFLWSCRDGLAQLKTRLRGSEPNSPMGLRDILLDIAIIAVFAWPFDASNLLQSLFLPLALIGKLRLGAKIWPDPYARVLNDRVLLSLSLLGATIFGQPHAIAGGLTLLIIALSLYFKRDSQLTRA